jgi:hypothetical protein
MSTTYATCTGRLLPAGTHVRVLQSDGSGLSHERYTVVLDRGLRYDDVLVVADQGREYDVDRKLLVIVDADGNVPAETIPVTADTIVRLSRMDGTLAPTLYRVVGVNPHVAYLANVVTGERYETMVERCVVVVDLNGNTVPVPAASVRGQTITITVTIDAIPDSDVPSPIGDFGVVDLLAEDLSEARIAAEDAAAKVLRAHRTLVSSSSSLVADETMVAAPDGTF